MHYSRGNRASLRACGCGYEANCQRSRLPGVRVRGKLIPLVWKLLLLLFAWEIVTLVLPLLLNIVVVVAVWPTAIVSNDKLAGDALSVPSTAPGSDTHMLRCHRPTPCGRATPS